MTIRLHIRPARNYQRPLAPGRGRLTYGFLVLLVIAAGLLLRSSFLSVPPFLSKYGGDALWALMIFIGLGFVFLRAGTLTLALCALGISWAVEFSQIYHTPWLDAVRATLPGRLILGSTFNLPDLPAYAVGIAVGAVSEVFLNRSVR